MAELEFMQQARWLAEQRRYKPAWVCVVFRQRYGKWPGESLKESGPMPASEAFLAWLSGYWAGRRPEQEPGRAGRGMRTPHDFRLTPAPLGGTTRPRRLTR